MAGTVTQEWTNEQRGENRVKVCTLTCVGDAADGSIPDTAFNSDKEANGWYLYSVKAFPTAGGTAPDAASVFILDADSLDLLGSEDNGTTAWAGLNLIHETLARKCLPNLNDIKTAAHVSFYPIITSELTLRVVDQATVSADYTIKCTFIR